MKKPLITLVLIITSIVGISQTYSIAMKSLSLTEADSFPILHERFGMIYEPPPIIKIERVMNAKDTLTIITLGKVVTLAQGMHNRVEMETHTVSYHPVFNDLSLDADSLIKAYPAYVEWVGFDEKKKEGKKEFILTLGIDFPPSMLLLFFMSGLLYLRLIRHKKESSLAL
jgi:hypothetical protein